jgi:hypothetical protein
LAAGAGAGGGEDSWTDTTDLWTDAAPDAALLESRELRQGPTGPAASATASRWRSVDLRTARVEAALQGSRHAPFTTHPHPVPPCVLFQHVRSIAQRERGCLHISIAAY